MVARGAEEKLHNWLPLQEAPTGKNNQSIKIHKPFSYPEVQLLQLAQTVYYSREYEEEKRQQKRTKEKAQALEITVETVMNQPEEINSQRWKGMGLLLLWKGGASQAKLLSGI